VISQKKKRNSIVLAAGLILLIFSGSVTLAGDGVCATPSRNSTPAVVRGQLGGSFMPAPEKKPSLSDSVKGGFDKMTGMFSSKKRDDRSPVKDELALSNRAEPSAKLHAALARVYESQGRIGDAEAEFRKAIKLEPKSRLALLEYARFLDRREQFDAAVGLYRHAEKVLRNDPAVQNDLGLCYARHDRCDQAIAAFEKAVSLAPKNVLYRNNLAMVLVELGREDDAMKHLLAVNGRAVAEYNMGYLLLKKGRRDSARRHFEAAANYNSHMKEAAWWVARLNAETPHDRSNPAVAQTRSEQGPRPPAIPSRQPRMEPTLQARNAPTPRRPEYAASRPRAAQPEITTVWAQSAKGVVHTPGTEGTSPALERLPELRQPGTVIPFRNPVRRSLASPTAERLPPPPPNEAESLEPLPAIRR